MYHKDDLIVGFNLLDCQIIKIEGNEYTLECVHCHKLYKYDVDYAPYIALKTVQGNVVPWTPSISDVLAEDWMVM